jgi:hypothetical protein
VNIVGPMPDTRRKFEVRKAKGKGWELWDSVPDKEPTLMAVFRTRRDAKDTELAWLFFIHALNGAVRKLDAEKERKETSE